jgi:putative redox protein
METRKAYIRQIKGISFAGKTDSNHWVITDGKKEFGGNEAGTSPKELLLISLGGCTGSDVVSILEKKRVNLDGFEMNLTADVSDGVPQVYTKIHIEYVFYGKDIKEKDVERAIELSQTKYCGVSEMLRHAMEITYSHRIESGE